MMQISKEDFIRAAIKAGVHLEPPKPPREVVDFEELCLWGEQARTNAKADPFPVKQIDPWDKNAIPNMLSESMAKTKVMEKKDLAMAIAYKGYILSVVFSLDLEKDGGSWHVSIADATGKRAADEICLDIRRAFLGGEGKEYPSPVKGSVVRHFYLKRTPEEG